MQLHKRFTQEQVKAILNGYQQGNLTVQESLDLLEVKSTTFFTLVRQYRKNPETFSIEYKRLSPRKISSQTEKMIQQALYDDRQLVENPKIPVRELPSYWIRQEIPIFPMAIFQDSH